MLSQPQSIKSLTAIMLNFLVTKKKY
jgi:hypothetical protein